MSDNATLVERLRVGLMASAAFVRGNPDRKKRMNDALDALEEASLRIGKHEILNARITELEAERDKAREELAALMIRHSFATGHGDTISGLLDELDWQLSEQRARDEA